jgi:hypothetical protein
MPTFHPALAVWLRAHHGVISRAMLLALGVTRAAIEAMLVVGELVAIHQGVYRHAMWPDTFLSRCAAISAADPRLTICCGGAGRLWTFRRIGGIGLHASTSSTGIQLDDGTLIHRCPVMPPEHIHERADGIRVTSPACTVFDIAKHVGARDLESVIEQGLRRSQFDIPTLYGVGRLLCSRGRAGSRLFAQVVGSRPVWRRPVDSHPELVLLEALSARGVHLRTQVKLNLADGNTIHPDLGDASVGFYIEIDDHEWHGGRLASAYDDRRDRRVRLGGGRVERVSTDEIDHLAPQLIDDLVAAYRQQRSLSLRTA